MTVPIAGRGPQILAVYGLFTALTTLTVSLRTYCRAFVGTNCFGWDDGLTVVAWIFFVCYSSFAIAGAHHGTGQHAWNIHPASDIPVGLKFWWLCEPLYVLSNMGIKASIGVMLLRLTIDPIHRYTIYVTLVITELFSLGFFFLFIFQCQPSSYFWTRYVDGSGECIDPRITIGFTYAYSAITCAGDWIYAILPMILVWNLQMPRTQKLFVGGVLAMGAIASAATIARIPYISTMKDTDDFLYATTDVALWSCCETGLGITACCCATLRPLFRTWLKPLATHRLSPSSRNGASRAQEQHGVARVTGNAGHYRQPSKEFGMGKNSIMCNTSLNVSDEVELVSKGSEQNDEAIQGGDKAHNYRHRW
ncbi:uncharacterized protein LTR77_009843 [Saxophila tyrrhenica]|uniref:Rhodopsin domain-containing protein n=1 Tax=Saxophila tyrrhenica TaxID=1690608 RepID=A0AAV9NXG8_9PEZI|nr:hypothetical protein LTR77_009843 [Saxophila tyrrhenica]